MNKMQLAVAVRDVASNLELSGTNEQDRIAKAFTYLADLIEAIEDDDPAECETTESPEREGHFKYIKNDLGNVIVFHNGIVIGSVQPPHLDARKMWHVLNHGTLLTRYKTRRAASERLLTLHQRGY